MVSEVFGATTVQSLDSKTYVKAQNVLSENLDVAGTISTNNIIANTMQPSSIDISNSEYFVFIGNIGSRASDPDPAEQFLMNGNACVGNLQVGGGLGDGLGTIYCSGTIQCDKALNLPRYRGNIDRDTRCTSPQTGTMIVVVNSDDITAQGVQIYDGATWRTLNWQ